MKPAPAVITPIDEHMGLDIARSLGRKGIPVFGFDANPGAPGRYSRYVQFVQGVEPEAQDEAAFADRLVEFGKTLPTRAVLYPLSDRHVLTCSDYRSKLEPYYLLVLPDREVLEGLTTKDGLQRMSTQFGIPSPRTFHVDGREQLEMLIPELVFPALLKPLESTYWHTPEITKLLKHGLLAGRAKVIPCPDAGSLLLAYDQIQPLDPRLVVQEVIPGEDERLIYVMLYFDRESRPLGLFAGRKHRIIPTGFGSASYARSESVPVAEEVARSLLSRAGYRGLVGVELKEDPRDGIFKLIEVNTRFGMWDGLGARCGVDLAYIAYRDALGDPLPPQLHFREGVIWVDWQRDLRASLSYVRSGKLTPGEWLDSMRGEKMWAIYDHDDWRPGAMFTLSLFQKLGDRLFQRSGHVAGSHG